MLEFLAHALQQAVLLHDVVPGCAQGRGGTRLICLAALEVLCTPVRCAAAGARAVLPRTPRHTITRAHAMLSRKKRGARATRARTTPRASAKSTPFEGAGLRLPTAKSTLTVRAPTVGVLFLGAPRVLGYRMVFPSRIPGSCLYRPCPTPGIHIPRNRRGPLFAKRGLRTASTCAAGLQAWTTLMSRPHCALSKLDATEHTPLLGVRRHARAT